MKRKYIWEQAGWTQFSWDNDRLIEPLGQARYHQGNLLARVRALGMTLGKEAHAEILTEETIKTSAIEGETLQPDAVRSGVARQLGLPTGGLAGSDRHVDGLVEVLLDATVHYAQPLTPERLKAWHAALFPTGYSGLRPIRVAKWRGPQPMRVVSGPIGKERIHFEAPPSDQIKTEMRQFFSWWHTSLSELEGLLRAGVAHFYFVTIHPFEDGNGRIARALTDMALAQDEKSRNRFYSFSSQIMRERKMYYDVLEACSKGTGDITPWLVWFLGCFTRAIQQAEKIIAKVLAKAEFWQKHAETPLDPRQRKVINRLLDVGRGGFAGGLTTRKYVSMTKTSRATAFREISDLVHKGILKQNQGKGRSVSYNLKD